MTDTPPPADPAPEDHEAESGEPQATRPGSFRAFPLLIVAVLIAIFAFVQVYRRHGRDEERKRKTAEAVSSVGLTVEWSENKRLPLYEIPWTEGMTVRDLLLAAQENGKITFEETGAGEAAMVTGIGEAKNEGPGTTTKNWIYRIGPILGRRSFAVQELQPSDIVLWKFGSFE